MSTSVETYPGQDFSMSQLLYAVRKKLQHVSFSGRPTTTTEKAEVDLLEHEFLQMLSSVRSTKNSFVPINRIPPEVLSLVAHNCDEDEDLITLTHVCHRWREIFTSCPSLWTSLECEVVDKTRVYLERSKASPLKISLEDLDTSGDAFYLLLPHLGRLGNLSLFRSRRSNLLELTKHLGSPAPLLKNLKLVVASDEKPVLQDNIFDGDLSSLRRLHLDGVISNLAWENVSNLQTFILRDIPGDKVSVNKLLHLFERAPLLRKIDIDNALPDSSDAPPGRVEPLPNLELLRVETCAEKSHTILLNHLSIPTGALITQDFDFSDANSPILFHLPKTFENLENLSNIASINLGFDTGVDSRLNGPSGGLVMCGSWDGNGPSPTLAGCQGLRSLSAFRISEVERLTISYWSHTLPRKGTNRALVYQTLLLMGNLRALSLTSCVNLSFIIALNPKENTSRALICPKLEELTVYGNKRGWFCGEEILEMAKERSFRGAKLKTVTFIDPQELIPAREVFELRAYVSHVEHKFDGYPPRWDSIPGVPDNTGYESDE